MNISLQDQDYEFLKNNDWLNVSGLIREAIKLIKGEPSQLPAFVDMNRGLNPGNKDPETITREYYTPKVNRSKLGPSKLIKCPHCGYEWEYKGKKSYIQCVNCNKRIDIS